MTVIELIEARARAQEAERDARLLRDISNKSRVRARGAVERAQRHFRRRDDYESVRAKAP